MLKLEQGRPADTSGRLEKEIRVYDFLDTRIVKNLKHKNIIGLML